MLTIEFFPLFFYDVIVSYAKQNYRSISSDLNYIDEFCIQQSREDIKLGINNIEPSFWRKILSGWKKKSSLSTIWQIETWR